MSPLGASRGNILHLTCRLSNDNNTGSNKHRNPETSKIAPAIWAGVATVLRRGPPPVSGVGLIFARPFERITARRGPP